MRKNKVNIEAEKGELVIQNANGDKAIIPTHLRERVEQMIAEGCHGCIDRLVSTLPVVDSSSKIKKAADGAIVPKKSSINYKRNELQSLGNLPNYSGSNIPPISIVADVVYKPKFTIEDLMEDKGDKLKAPKELKEIAVNYGKVLDRLDTKEADDRDIELLNDTLDKFYTNPLNIGDKDESSVNYAENLANQLRDIYKAKVKVIAYDKSNEKSKKAMQNIDKNAILITGNNFMTKDIPATNILFSENVTKSGVDMLINMDQKKAEIAKDLTERYSTKNNSLIRNNITFDKDFPVSIEGRFGALGEFTGDEIRLTDREDAYKSNNDTWESTLRHEMSHSQDYNIFMNSDNHQTIKKYIPENNDNLGYYRDPGEVQARINQIRNDAGIKEIDRGTKNVGEKLNNYIENGKNIKAYKDLLKVTNKETVIKLLNEIAVNSIPQKIKRLEGLTNWHQNWLNSNTTMALAREAQRGIFQNLSNLT